MIEGLILIEGENLSGETLRSLSLGNALQLVIGSVPGGGVILHVAADSPAYLGAALLDFAQVPGVTRVYTLALQTPRWVAEKRSTASRNQWPRHQASCKTTIHVPADTVWQVITDFGAACQYLAMVVNCVVEGPGVGTLRTLISADRSMIIERLEALDEESHRHSYTLLTDMPFGSFLTTMNVRGLGPKLVELAWSATFEADGLPASDAVDLLEGAPTANYLALKQFLERWAMNQGSRSSYSGVTVIEV